MTFGTPVDMVDSHLELGKANPGFVSNDDPQVEKISQKFVQDVQIVVEKSHPVVGGIVPIFTVCSENGVNVDVFQDCIDGLCKCVHFVDGKVSQLLPCRAACYLKQDKFGISKVEADFLWSGIVDGFKIVDSDCVTTYECENYNSIL